MRDLGERCGKHRVARLLKREGLRSQTGYGRWPGMRGGKPAVVAPNHLQRQFTVDELNRAWVTDITYIRTQEGWPCLAVVVDLFSRQVVGWSRGNSVLQCRLSAATRLAGCHARLRSQRRWDGCRRARSAGRQEGEQAAEAPCSLTRLGVKSVERLAPRFLLSPRQAHAAFLHGKGLAHLLSHVGDSLLRDMNRLQSQPEKSSLTVTRSRRARVSSLKTRISHRIAPSGACSAPASSAHAASYDRPTKIRGAGKHGDAICHGEFL